MFRRLPVSRARAPVCSDVAAVLLFVRGQLASLTLALDTLKALDRVEIKAVN